MSGLFRKSMAALSGVLIASSVAARQPSAHSFPSAVSLGSQSQYAGAVACKDCHAAQFEAWEKTKHSKALNKLQPADRAGGKCIKCHVTGTAEQIAAEADKPSFPNVQCEACHGAGQLHVDAAKTGDNVTDLPKHTVEETCTKCHNETSPHYKPFFYQALVGVVHMVKK
jgi:hypothetical protein